MQYPEWILIFSPQLPFGITAEGLFSFFIYIYSKILLNPSYSKLKLITLTATVALFVGKMDAWNAGIDEDIQDIKDAFSSLDDTSVVDNLVKQLNKVKTETKKSNILDYSKIKDTTNTPKSGSGSKGKNKDEASSIKDLKDAVNDLKEAFDSAYDSLFDFKNVFNKLDFERFSPGKLLRRTTKYFSKFKEWGEGLGKLGKMGIGQNVIQELRGMGIESLGIVQGLIRSTSAQRSSILSNISGISNMATAQASAVVRHEHKGTITVKDGDKITTLNIDKKIAEYIKNNINKYIR